MAVSIPSAGLAYVLANVPIIWEQLQIRRQARASARCCSGKV